MDTYKCRRDIYSIFEYESFWCWIIYGEYVINNLFNISQTMIREQSITPSLKTLSDFIDDGITWWAPIPENRYQSRDGRGLNLEVICTMMVRTHPYITAYVNWNYLAKNWNYLLCTSNILFCNCSSFSLARLHTNHTIHLILSTRIFSI